jgi:hypothetical protein
MYSLVHVCIFCSQFFDPDFPDGIAYPVQVEAPVRTVAYMFFIGVCVNVVSCFPPCNLFSYNVSSSPLPPYPLLGSGAQARGRAGRHRLPGGGDPAAAALRHALRGERHRGGRGLPAAAHRGVAGPGAASPGDQPQVRGAAGGHPGGVPAGH